MQNALAGEYSQEAIRTITKEIVKVWKQEEKSWVTEKNQINEVIQQHFSNLNCSEGARDYGKVLQEIPRMVSEDMNCKLMKQPGSEEVKAAVFQLGALKAPGRNILSQVLGYCKRSGGSCTSIFFFC